MFIKWLTIFNINNNIFILYEIKTETIGDAYCVASGLHFESSFHAIRAAFMALKMMEAVRNFKPQGLDVKSVQVWHNYKLIITIK